MAFGVVLLFVIGFENLPAMGDESFGDSFADALEGELSRELLVPMLLLRAAVAIGVIWVIVGHRRQGLASVGLPRKKVWLDTLIGIAAVPLVYGLIYMSIGVVWLVHPDWLDQMEENADRLMDLIPKMTPARRVVSSTRPSRP